MISQVIVANSDWGDYATEYVQSVLSVEPHVEIILVDNGSKKPYAPSHSYKLVRIETAKNYGYTKALNAGLKQTTGDWLLLGNDDVICEDSFSILVHSLEKHALYGPELRSKGPEFGTGEQIDYLYGWYLLMHRDTYKKVGAFDEYYLHAGFDDIDYCWRAAQLGVPLKVVHLPFVHLADAQNIKHRRMQVQGYRENMARSKAYFIGKVEAAYGIRRL